MTRADAQLLLEKFLGEEIQKLTAAIQEWIGGHWICSKIDRKSVLFRIVDKDNKPFFGQDFEIRRELNFGETQPIYNTNIGTCGVVEIKETYQVGDRGLYYIDVATILTNQSLNEIVRETLIETDKFYQKLSNSIEWKI